MDALSLKIIKEEITDLLILDLEGKTKEEALLNISNYAKDKGLIKDTDTAYEKFLEKEKRACTATGGIALPEACWIDMSRPYAYILCRTKEGVNFGSADKIPVRIILAFLGRDKDDLSKLRFLFRFNQAFKSEMFLKSFMKVDNEKSAYLVLCDYTIGQDKLRKKYIARENT